MLRFSTIVIALMFSAAAPASDLPALGLSASPDSYVGEIEVDYGDPFTLYVFLSGPGGEALSFDLESLDWSLLATCCGGSPALYGNAVFGEGMEHEGDPSLSVTSTAETCLQDDFVLLATLEFDWIVEPAGPFYLGAVAHTVRDCEGESRFVTGLPLVVVPNGITPAERETWSGIKRTYR